MTPSSRMHSQTSYLGMDKDEAMPCACRQSSNRRLSDSPIMSVCAFLLQKHFANWVTLPPQKVPFEKSQGGILQIQPHTCNWQPCSQNEVRARRPTDCA